MSGIQNYPNVFKPLQLTKKVTLKNRIEFSPHIPALAPMSGDVNEAFIQYIKANARTGVGQVIIGDTLVDRSRGEPFVGEIDLTSPLSRHGLINLVREAHKHNAKLGIELSHGGFACGGTPEKLALSPSPMPFPTKVMDRADMDEVLEYYRVAALRVLECGFDNIFLHFGHGSALPASFLSPDINQRTDEYGGSLENRMRFPLEILKTVREAVGPDIAIEMRISGSDMCPTGLQLEDTIEFCKVAQKYINLIHISNGRFGPESIWGAPSYLAPHMINIERSKAVKDAVDIPVAVVGNINSLEEAEYIIANGYADVVAMARALIAGPTMLRDAVNGEPEMTAPCIHCMDGCRGPFEISSLRCCVNPVAGLEHRYAKIGKSENKLKLMIIGGGPGGMQAAKTGMQRGHDVTLYEKSDSLGGRLKDATLLPFKEDLRRYLKWAIMTTEKSGAKIVYNTEVTQELIDKENPDYIIVATGAKYLKPDIEGINGAHVHMLRDVDAKEVEVGSKVVVCGGGVSGVECAIQLAREGKDVTVVDMVPADQFCGTMFPIIKGSVFYYAMEAGVKFLGEHKVVSFNEQGVVVEGPDGQLTLEADDAVIAFGLESINDLYYALASQNPFKVSAVGDCISPATVFQATTTAFDIVVDL